MQSNGSNSSSPKSVTLNYTEQTKCGGSNIQACTLYGTGNASDPYAIDSISCLQEMEDGKACHYKLTQASF